MPSSSISNLARFLMVGSLYLYSIHIWCSHASNSSRGIIYTGCFKFWWQATGCLSKRIPTRSSLHVFTNFFKQIRLFCRKKAVICWKIRGYFSFSWKHVVSSDIFPIKYEIRQSKINSRWVARPIGQTNRRPSVWCSKYYFFST